MNKIYLIVLHCLLIFISYEVFSVTREYDRLKKTFSHESQPPLAPGDVAPVFRGKDVMSGEERIFENKLMVIGFYTTWCPHCQVTAPKWSELSKYAQAHGYNMIAIAADDKEKVKRFSDSLHLSFKSYVPDEVQKTYADFKVSSLPVTYLVNAEGKIMKAHVGELNNENLEEFKKLLK